MSVSLYLPQESGIDNFDQLGHVISGIPVHSEDAGTLKMRGSASNAPDGGTIFEIYNWQLEKGTHGRVCVEGMCTQFARKALADLLASHGGRIEKNDGTQRQVNDSALEKKTVADVPPSTFSIMFHGSNQSPEELVDAIVERVSTKTAAKVKEGLNPRHAEVNQIGKTTIITFFPRNLDEVMGEVSEVVTMLLRGKIVSYGNRKEKILY